MVQRHFELDKEDDNKLLNLCRIWKMKISQVLRKLIREAKENSK